MKKFFKKYRGVIIIVLSILAFILLSILIENSKIEKNLDEFKANFEKDEYAITVIALTSCPHCHNFSPIIKNISKEYDLPLYWINIDTLSKEDRNYLYELFEPYGYEGSSPYIAVSNNGKVIDSHTGEMDKENTLDFLKNAGVIK